MAILVDVGWIRDQLYASLTHSVLHDRGLVNMHHCHINAENSNIRSTVQSHRILGMIQGLLELTIAIP